MNFTNFSIISDEHEIVCVNLSFIILRIFLTIMSII